MELTVAEKIKIILGRKKMTVSDLAKKMGTTPQNLHNKLKRSNFDEKEIRDISAALNCEYRITFFMDDGNEI